MKLKSLKGFALSAATVALGIAGAISAPDASAQAAEQFFPLLSYRTGPYAPNGTPWATHRSMIATEISASRWTLASRARKSPPLTVS